MSNLLNALPVVLLLACLAAGLSGSAAPAGDGSDAAALVFPAADWQRASPESQGLDPRKLEEAMAIVAEIAQDHADGTPSAGNTRTIVVRNGYLVWSGTDVDAMQPIYSCTKSFMSSVFGLLYDDGKCSPDTRAADILPALREQYPEATLGQFATLTSGYNVPWRTSPFEIRPPLHPPGAAFHYSASSHRLGHMLTRVAGESMRKLFDRRIAQPIGIDRAGWDWPTMVEIDGLPVCGGASGVSITARNLARFGLLFLAKGRWGDRRILSEKWVEISTSPRVAPDVPPYEKDGWYVHLPGRYGYNWWCNGVNSEGEWYWRNATPKTFAAQGNRNNYCFVIPEWHMVLVRMGQGKPIESRLYDRVFAKLQEALE
jgi:CubicO group peptidase (beta-lactamase class C family)